VASALVAAGLLSAAIFPAAAQPLLAHAARSSPIRPVSREVVEGPGQDG
jgi:hypothetical protein